MKSIRWYAVMMVVVLSLGLIVGCGGDDDDNPAGPGGGNEGDLSLDDLSETQAADVVENPATGMNASAQNSMSVAGGLKAQMNGGGVAPLSMPQDLLKDFETLAEAPEGWMGPDDEGWYSYIGDGYEYGVMEIRMTPDQWADDWDGSELSKIEYSLRNSIEQGVTSIDYTWTYWAETNTGRTMMDGAYEWDVLTTTSAGGQDISYEYGWDLSWDNVSLEANNYSGNFHSSGLFPVVTATGTQMVATATDISLDATGNGSGTGSIAGTEYVRYTFEGVSGGYISGYYTLLREDWNTNHDINWMVIR